MKRITVLVLLLAILLTAACIQPASVLTTTEKETMYADALAEFEAYLENGEGDVSALNDLLSVFDELKNYKQSKYLRYYVEVLIAIEEEQYDTNIEIDLQILNDSTAFSEYLGNGLSGSPIRPVQELSTYYSARQAEYMGDTDGAISLYKGCMSFFDSSDRYRQLLKSRNSSEYKKANQLLKNGDYDGTYCIYQKLGTYSDCAEKMKAIEKTIGYKPANNHDNPGKLTGFNMNSKQPGKSTITWSKAAHATNYIIRYRAKNSSNWSTKTVRPGNAVAYTIEGLKEGMNYTIEMTAVCCDIQTQWYTGNCDAMKATLTPKPTPTPKPRNFTLDSGITASGGYVTVKWTDSANRSPYMVYTQQKVRNELADWYYEWTTDAKSMRLENLAPGREYEITVEDCDGNWISRTYTIPSAASFSDGQLKTNSIRTTIEYRQEPAGSGGSGMKSVDSISASAILRDMGKTDYGIYYWIRYPQPAYSREYFTQAFFVDPYAQANCVNYFIWTYGKQYSGLTG